eukprot:12479602-Prorocentrum_lima.AAC.1
MPSVQKTWKPTMRTTTSHHDHNTTKDWAMKITDGEDQQTIDEESEKLDEKNPKDGETPTPEYMITNKDGKENNSGEQVVTTTQDENKGMEPMKMTYAQ